MNQQLRRLFIVVLATLTFLGLAATNSRFLQVLSLNIDGRDECTIFRTTEAGRGPIIVNGTAIASSSKMEDSQCFQRSYADGPLYVSIAGYFSPAFSQATGLKAAAKSAPNGQARALLAQRLCNLFSGANRQGGGLVLTIDPVIQEVRAARLEERKDAITVLDAKTGTAPTLYSLSSYDPNVLVAFDIAVVEKAHRVFLEDTNDPFVNRAIGGSRYAPGSAFEILISVALLENGVANPDTPLDSPVSTLSSNTETSVSNIEPQICGDGQPTLLEAFARSCNASFVTASQSLTHGQFADVATRFGFGSVEPIPPPITPSVFPEQTDAVQLAAFPIDQFFVQVTPMQMVRVAQVVVNEGTLVRPHLTSQAVDADLVVRFQTSPVSTGQVVTPEVAQSVTEMMKGVISAPYGTDQSMAIGNIQVAAKTGIAGIGIDDRVNAWATDFAPTGNPQIAFAIIVEGDGTDPAPHGGDVAGPITRSLLEVRLR